MKISHVEIALKHEEPVKETVRNGLQVEKTLQFLVCPQNDFIDGVDANGKTRAVNKLHVGPDGARKLRGDPARNEPDYFVETVSRFFDDQISGTENLTVIIDEDWHPKMCDEFAVFGPHCIKGQWGAELPGQLEEHRRHRRCQFIRANSINIASDHRYEKVLRQVCGNTKSDRIRVGVLGVWTHVKVEYLLIGLNTLWPNIPFSQMGVCEPLCAAPDKEMHRLALDKLRSFTVNVFGDRDDYCRNWLGLRY